MAAGEEQQDSYTMVLDDSRGYDEISEEAGCADSTDCQIEDIRSLDGKPTPKRRGTAWNDDQTNLLLEKWSDYRGIGDDIEKESNVIQNASVYKTISRFLIENSVDKTAEQCKTRIHTLKRSYKVCKAAMVKDINAKKMFRYYDKMDYILGFRSKDPGRPPRSDPETSDKDKPETFQYRSGSSPTEMDSSRTLWTSDNMYSQVPQSHADARMYMIPSTTQETPSAVCIKQEVIEQADDVPPSKKVRSEPSDPTDIGSDKPKDNGCTYAQLQNVGAYQLAEPATSSYTTLKNMGAYGAIEPANLVIGNKLAAAYNVDSPTQYQQLDSAGNFTTYGKSSAGKDENANTFNAVEGDAIQRLKLDLEIKKIEMERKKLEIEERQRREEREHQFRMMQLILNGLGQGAAAGIQSEHLTAEAAEGFQNWRQQQTRQPAAEQDVTLSDSQFL